MVGAASQERGPRAHAAYTGLGLFPPCAAKLAALVSWLSSSYPAATVRLSDGDAFDDFARMALAPTLVKDSSSFSLWAGMANSGRVVSPLLPEGRFGRPARFDNPRWTWSDATVLYPDVARALGLNVSDTAAVIRWLVEH